MSGGAGGAYNRTFKRLIDLALVIPSLVLLSPLLIVIWALVLVRLGRPVLFRQDRPGRGGIPFQMLKFRTMLDERTDDGQLRPDKDRLTAFGAVLRRTSLDELPELINVFRGEMSLVGPRPLLMRYLQHYSSEQARRHDVRPGITGWAQVNGRNAISWEQKFELDVWYVDHVSMRLDFIIIARTIAKVLAREGVEFREPDSMPYFVGSGNGTADGIHGSSDSIMDDPS